MADKALREFLRAEEEKETAADSAEFPELKEGQTLRGVSTKMTRHWTKPPAHYTEGSLLSAMEQAGKKRIGRRSRAKRAWDAGHQSQYN